MHRNILLHISNIIYHLINILQLDQNIIHRKPSVIKILSKLSNYNSMNIKLLLFILHMEFIDLLIELTFLFNKVFYSYYLLL